MAPTTPQRHQDTKPTVEDLMDALAYSMAVDGPDKQGESWMAFLHGLSQNHKQVLNELLSQTWSQAIREGRARQQYNEQDPVTE